MTDIKTRSGGDILMQKVADEAVLLDMDRQVYFGLDAVGTLIWEAISENLSEADIVSRITAEFDVDAEIAQRDLRDFLEQLRRDQLISPE